MTEKTTGARSSKEKEQDAPEYRTVNWTKWGTVIGIVALSLTVLYATFEIAEWKSRVDDTVNTLDGFAEWKTTVKQAVDSLDPGLFMGQVDKGLRTDIFVPSHPRFS